MRSKICLELAWPAMYGSAAGMIPIPPCTLSHNRISVMSRQGQSHTDAQCLFPLIINKKETLYRADCMTKVPQRLGQAARAGGVVGKFLQPVTFPIIGSFPTTEVPPLRAFSAYGRPCVATRSLDFTPSSGWGL